MRIETPLGEDVLLLERFAGADGVSMPFEFRAGLLSQNPAVDASALLRKPVTIALRLVDDSEAYFNGIVSSFVQLESGADLLTAYEATIVPSTYLTTIRWDCRIFQDQSVSDIISAVLDAAGITNYSLSLTASYAAREYCVQYRETDWDFINRLCEEEGIFYFFKHTSSSHTLVFADASSAIASCPGQASARVTGVAGGVFDTDLISTTQLEQTVFTPKATLRDFDFEKPSVDLTATDSIGEDAEELYDYPGGYVTVDDGQRYAGLLAEQLQCLSQYLRGSSNCRAFRSGYKVELKEHIRADANQAYTLLRVGHKANDNNYRSTTPVPFSYSNTFEAIPNSTKFRPPRKTRRALVAGPQTAVVVGPSGEEIYVDQYGRVKVSFHWDRQGQKDGTDSCWVRVAQIWAGTNWGWITIPRVGQEVIVDFLEGNPDRPIITGRVYNADRMPPYALPDSKTQSGWKSRSSLGGGTADFNEIRFEDKAGSEQLFIHAQKDRLVEVENDETQDIGHDRSETVHNDETITIQHNRTETVNNDESITIGHNRTESVAQKEDITIGTERSTSIGQKDALTVGQEQSISVGQKITVTAGTEITLMAGPNTIKMDASGITIQSPSIVTIQGSLVKIN